MNYQPLHNTTILSSEQKLLSVINDPSSVCQILNVCNYCTQQRAFIKLSCGHSYCHDDVTSIINSQTDGMFLLNDFEIKSPTSCQICQKSISDVELKFILGDTYKDYEDMKNTRIKYHQNRLDEELGIVICPMCSERKTKNDYDSEHSCLCDKCAKKYVKINNLCPICNEVIRPVEKIKAIPPKCEYCYEIILEFSSIECQNHLLCSNCEYFSYLNQQCISCQRPFNPTEFSLISLKYLTACNICNQSFSAEFFKETLCSCNLCENCFHSCVQENGCVCKFCQRLVKDIEPSFFNRFIEPLKASMKSCEICTDNFLRDNMLTLSCDHYFCKNCLLSYLENQIGANLISPEGIKCPSCPEMIAATIMSSILPEKLFDYFNKILIKRQFNISECPKCKSEFESDQKQVQCPKCQHIFCSDCLQDSHEGGCDQSIIKNIINMMEESGDVVAECPGCYTPYTKDKGCEHVKCEQSSCSIEFCFKCSCYRSPTVAHGNHYHRPECPFFADYNGADEYNAKDCSECKKYQKLCTRPKKLKTLRRFEENERS